MADAGSSKGTGGEKKKRDKATAEDTPPAAEGTSSQGAESTSDYLMSMLKRAMNLGEEKPKPEQLLEEVSLEGVIKYIKSGKCKNIITMAGAGISTSAGIPDFRSPGTGLYDNLQKYNLPSPQAIFELEFFKENPEPFFQLAKELWPGTFKPTPCHYFLRLLAEKKLLLRHFTQNIDTLERVAGIGDERIVEAHGTFHTAHCVSGECRAEYTQQWLKEKVFAEVMPKCEKCESLVKPDIVFFGEALPSKFFNAAKTDIPQCDLLIVMGTSLVVQPFASLTARVPETTPRLYVNKEKSSGSVDPFAALFGMGTGFDFDSEDNYRDVFFENTCDDGCLAIADMLGWGDELRALVASEHERIDKESKSTTAQQSADSTEAGTSTQHGTSSPPSSTKPDDAKTDGKL